VESATQRAGFAQRLLGAFLLRRETYDEIASDPSALAAALLVTLAGATAQAVGLAGMFPFEDDGAITLARLATSLAAAMFTWIVPTAVLWAIATRLVHGRRVALDALLRTVGFAAAPELLYFACGALHALALGDAARWAIAIIAWLLTQGALFIAVQETLETSAVRTIAIFALAGIVTGIVGLALSTVLPPALWQPLLL
jgi:hypothetical protein